MTQNKTYQGRSGEEGGNGIPIYPKQSTQNTQN